MNSCWAVIVLAQTEPTSPRIKRTGGREGEGVRSCVEDGRLLVDLEPGSASACRLRVGSRRGLAGVYGEVLRKLSARELIQ